MREDGVWCLREACARGRGTFIHAGGQKAEQLGTYAGKVADVVTRVLSWPFLAYCSFPQTHLVPGYQLKWTIGRMWPGGLRKEEKV